MSAIQQIKVLDNVSHQYIVGDIGAKAENVEFNNGSNLENVFTDFTGATSSAAGAQGLVPAPAVNDQNKYLKADGTWSVIEVSNDPILPIDPAIEPTTPGAIWIVTS